MVVLHIWGFKVSSGGLDWYAVMGLAPKSDWVLDMTWDFGRDSARSTMLEQSSIAVEPSVVGS
jgi:hypothetical protein